MFKVNRFLAIIALFLFVISMGSCGGGGGGNGSNNISTATIGPSGGSITSTDGKMKVEVPAGALISDTTINIAIVEDNYGQIGPVYNVYKTSTQEPEDLVFLAPVTVKVNYNPNLLPEGATEEGLKLGLVGPFDSWEILTNSTVDKANHLITATTNHFSSIGVLPNIPTGTPPKLGFPLLYKTPYSATISAVFDHSMSKPYCPENDSNNNGVVAFTGEGGSVKHPDWSVAIKDCDGDGYKDPLYGFKKSDGSTFSVLAERVNYSGNILYYDGHPGYDYPTNPVDVLAAASGRVHIVREKECWNNDTAKNGVKYCYGTIWIDHGNGYSTWYIHLKSKTKADGTYVQKGEKIGVSGNTAPFYVDYHLHFEVRKNNIPIDPYSENMWEVPQPLQGTISGSVKDAVTRTPLQGVSINVYSGSSIISSGTTDSNGVYSFSVPSGSGYRVEFSKTGYIPAIYENVSVEADATTYLETVLQIDTTHSGTGNASGKIVNALDGSGVSGLTIKLREGINVTAGIVIATTTTGSGGFYEFIGLNAGYYTAEVSGSGYNTTYFTVICIGGTTTSNQDATITPILSPGETRIILTWGETPRDLDSHLTGPLPDGTRFHMYWWHAELCESGCSGDGSPWPEYVKLDKDDTSSYGPETTTIYQQISGIYRYSVHDYTNGYSTYSYELSNSGAQVRVYRGNNLVATFNVPSNREGTLWTVFEMSGDAITPINLMSYESSPVDIQSVSGNSITTDVELIRNLPSKR